MLVARLPVITTYFTAVVELVEPGLDRTQCAGILLASFTPHRRAKKRMGV